MTVYLVDEPFVDVAVSYAAGDAGARLVLLQDAVYSATSVRTPAQLYVMEEDVMRRGLGSRIPSSVRIIGYEDLVAMMEEEKVVNFL